MPVALEKTPETRPGKKSEVVLVTEASAGAWRGRNGGVGAWRRPVGGGTLPTGKKTNTDL